jgi:Tfp pilus assembly protein PilP
MTPPPESETPTVVMAPTGEVKGSMPGSTARADALPKEPVFSSEPERWPMLSLRLIGIWRQGDQAEAVVANAAHWFRTQEGRQISLEGHRVWRIGWDDIHVRDPAGRLQTFQMEAGAP